MNLQPWFGFFRLPNLPTAPGDALAGAAFCAASGAAAPGAFQSAAAAGASALFFYMYGLADNDIAGFAAAKGGAQGWGAEEGRPLATGGISLRAARTARAFCLAAAFAAGAALPFAWWCAAAVLCALVFAYNRTKSKWLMGLCRGASAAAGWAAAVRPDAVRPSGLAGIALLSAGLALYVAAVTKLSEGEDRESEGLGNRRYLLGLAAFAPMAAFALLPPERALLPFTGCLFAHLAWCAAVAPLWRPHGPDARRRAVGRAVGALLYMHTGLVLAAPRPDFLAAAAALWIASRLARRAAPAVTGS